MVVVVVLVAVVLVEIVLVLVVLVVVVVTIVILVLCRQSTLALVPAVVIAACEVARTSCPKRVFSNQKMTDKNRAHSKAGSNSGS